MCPCWPGRTTWPCSCPVGCCRPTGFQLVLDFMLKVKYSNPNRLFKCQENLKDNEKDENFHSWWIHSILLYFWTRLLNDNPYKTKKIRYHKWHANHVTICWPKNIKKRLFCQQVSCCQNRQISFPLCVYNCIPNVPLQKDVLVHGGWTSTKLVSPGVAGHLHHPPPAGGDWGQAPLAHGQVGPPHRCWTNGMLKMPSPLLTSHWFITASSVFGFHFVEAFHWQSPS